MFIWTDKIKIKETPEINKTIKKTKGIDGIKLLIDKNYVYQRSLYRATWIGKNI